MEKFLLKLKILLALWNELKKENFPLLGVTVRSFESDLAKFLGAKHAIAVASGTDALILSLKACGIGPGDEVIVPAAGFYSTPGSVAWVNAKPVFVDIALHSFNIDPNKIGAAVTVRTKAIMPVHLNGRVADMDPILAIARGKGLKVIVDAAHAIGSQYKNKPIGAYGDLVCVSFNATKLFGTHGDGGAILTNDDALAATLHRLRLYGASRWQDIHTDNTVVGVASRLGVLEAAILKEKFASLPKNLERQRENYYLSHQVLKRTPGIMLPSDDVDYFINGYRLVVLTKKRDALSDFFIQHGRKIDSFYPVPLPFLPAFQNLGYEKGRFPIAERIGRESLVLLPHYSKSNQEIQRLCGLITEFVVNEG